jgi:hypothetical protein
MRDGLCSVPARDSSHWTAATSVDGLAEWTILTDDGGNAATLLMRRRASG